MRIMMSSQRTYKNFGHKREPIPTVTILWHGFLSFTFIGLGVEWKKIGNFIFGTEEGTEATLLTTELKES